MLFRTVQNPQPSPEADIDTPEMVETAALVAGGDEDVAMLAELARYGMELAKAQRDYAAARLAAVTAEGGALNPGEDPNAAFGKIAQTVRRTLALKAKLKAELEKRRAGLTTERAQRRAKRAEDHRTAVKDELDSALIDIFHSDLVIPEFDPSADHSKPDAYEIERDEMLEEAEFLLEDLDEHAGWLSRPVGETVAKLCADLGLPPDACFKRGDAWIVRRAPTTYEILLENRGVILPPSAYGKGQDAKRPGWGTVDDIHPRC